MSDLHKTGRRALVWCAVAIVGIVALSGVLIGVRQTQHSDPSELKASYSSGSILMRTVETLFAAKHPPSCHGIEQGFNCIVITVREGNSVWGTLRWSLSSETEESILQMVNAAEAKYGDLDLVQPDSKFVVTWPSGY